MRKIFYVIVEGNITGLFTSSYKKETLSVSILDIGNGIGINGILDKNGNQIYFNVRLLINDPIIAKTNVVELGKRA